MENIQPKKWEKELQNPPETPWMNWIETGLKIFEGRIFMKDWQKVKVGDTIFFSLIKDSVINHDVCLETVVTELRFFIDFGEAYRQLGDKLVPGRYDVPNDPLVPLREKLSEEEVKKMYSEYFSEADIRTYGVVAVGIRPIKYLAF
jgi:ASC-1-like (ASCH) protein